MPNRILRDGILASESVCSLSWAAEVFYRRLMSVADDHGRFSSAPKLLRSACYPLQIDKVSDADIGKWLTECVTAALVSVYPAADGKRYIQILKFGQQVRAKSKFPEPVESTCDGLLAIDSKSEQTPANAHLGVFVFGGVVEGGGEDGGGKRARAQPPQKPEGVDEQVWADWLQLRKAKKAPVTQTVIDGATAEAMKAGMSLEAFLRVWCARGSQGLQADWLKPDERPRDSGKHSGFASKNYREGIAEDGTITS